MSTKKVTIKQVAQEAAVSIQTVSRVINDRPDVADSTRRSVQAVIDRLGYQPNAIARSLIRKRSHTLGVVAADLALYGPMRGLSGIEQESTYLGYSLILRLVNQLDTDNGEQALSDLLARQVDGIVWAIPEIDDNRVWLRDRIDHLSIPIVFLGPSPNDASPPISASQIGGRMAAAHLRTQGYQHIGLITGPLAFLAARDRQRGWQEIVSDSEPTRIFNGDWSAASGEYGLKQLLQQYPQLDAVYASNDQMALGVLLAAHQLGRRVPEDLGVVGTDNIPESAYFWPPLTTIQLHMIERSRQAVRELSGKIETGQDNRTTSQTGNINLEPKLIIRHSSVLDHGRDQ